MRKRTGAITMIAAAAFIAIYPLPSQNEETAQENTLQVTEDQVSNVAITLIDIIDGDTINATGC
ncbi:hypothetical protein QNH48_14830 [Neobacillus sp. YX16]|uniref:hypothetical protein n=1 Tax=Neobacillus sp. YX16 TaxID=3047874 RepID=UPI0024C3AB4F|nr:hypothetical protein [Neobacillus sp. YX16]WHZ05816.1 hypothetical protein QNH48_14830 [Neobacillus sp. YX16]